MACFLDAVLTSPPFLMLASMVVGCWLVAEGYILLVVVGKDGWKVEG